MARSETYYARESLAKWCIGYGVDLGFGGDKIVPHAIAIDMPTPYTKLGCDPVQLGGDASDLVWFRDSVLDFVYSSHLLEDFEDTTSVLVEWVRVLKPGGYLILNLPNELLFRERCKHDGTKGNNAHKHADFSSEWVERCAAFLSLDIVHKYSRPGSYSFELVFKKR